MVVPESLTGTLKEETQGENLTGGNPRPDTGRALREAGRGTPSFGGTSILSDGQPLILTVELALQNLQAPAGEKGMKHLWRKLVEPWLKSQWPPGVGTPCAKQASAEQATSGASSSIPDDSKPQITDEVMVRNLADRMERMEKIVSRFEDARVAMTTATTDPPAEFVGDIPAKPWQEESYDKKNALWQAAAQRRHLHHRHSNRSIGVCSVDLSGPHEGTPQPGHRVGSSLAHYFLVLTVRFENETEESEEQATVPSEGGGS